MFIEKYSNSFNIKQNYQNIFSFNKTTLLHKGINVLIEKPLGAGFPNQHLGGGTNDPRSQLAPLRGTKAKKPARCTSQLPIPHTTIHQYQHLTIIEIQHRFIPTQITEASHKFNINSSPPKSRKEIEDSPLGNRGGQSLDMAKGRRRPPPLHGRHRLPPPLLLQYVAVASPPAAIHRCCLPSRLHTVSRHRASPPAGFGGGEGARRPSHPCRAVAAVAALPPA